MRDKLLIVLIVLICGTLAAESFPFPRLGSLPPGYICFKPVRNIDIDGNLIEPDWLQTPRTDAFIGIAGSAEADPDQRTQARMLWDETGLYIAIQVYDPHIWGSVFENDADLSADSHLSIFIDPDGDNHEYCRLDINPLGAVADRFSIRPPRDGNTSLPGWDLDGWEYAISCDGTPNYPLDTDVEWSVEMLLPWESLSAFANMECPPKDGDIWRINILRSQKGFEIQGDRYAAVHGEPAKQWVWSPQGVSDMEYPERWGYLSFTEKRIGVPVPDFEAPDAEQAKQYLARVYYAQKQHWLDNGEYAPSLAGLGLEPFTLGRKAIEPKIEVTSRTFIAVLDIGSAEHLMIGQDGRIEWAR